jgi:diacylglycerol O-acyltransferase / wax synthase
MANHFERLSGLDAAFLGFETPSTYMHVAVTAVFDAAGLRSAHGGIDMDRIRRHFAARLDRLPRFRQRLGFVPLVQDPVWVDDDNFDLSDHLRHVSLPRPGTPAQLQRCCAELLERPLNRSHPLWEAWVIEGVEDDAFALVVKVHHCIVDGIAGIGMLVALLDPTAIDVPAVTPEWTPRPAPNARALWRSEVGRRVEGALALGQSLANSAVHPVESVNRLRQSVGGVLGLFRRGLSTTPACAFNQPIGPHRRVAWFEVDLDRLKQVKQHLGGTINDAVLTAVGGAVGRVLRERQDPVGEGELGW